jgi:hypothetical protein
MKTYTICVSYGFSELKCFGLAKASPGVSNPSYYLNLFGNQVKSGKIRHMIKND